MLPVVGPVDPHDPSLALMAEALGVACWVQGCSSRARRGPGGALGGPACGPSP